MVESLAPAETALSLLFNKLHPLLEDAAHLLASGAPRRDFERLHLKLITARTKCVETLEALDEEACPDALGEVLEELVVALTPVGESFQQALVLTQLSLEEAPAQLLPFVPEGRAGSEKWGARMRAFLERLEDPAFGAERRWEVIDPDLGETEEE
ncbi:MAG: hypothetical protein U0P81_08055 [Holophagaceae bacterium]